MSEPIEGAAPAVTEDTAAVLTDVAEDQAAAPAEEGDTGDDAAADGEANADGETPQKRKQTYQERINEKTRLQREAERERDYWREQALRTQQPQQPQRQEPAQDAEPDPSNYEHGELDARFIREHAIYHAKQAFREEQAQAEARNRTQTAIQTFAQRVGEQFPEGEPAGLARLRTLPELSPVVQETIFDSDIGPKLADHLGQNLSELHRISALPPIKQARELAKLELKLASPPAPTAKTATDAPAPTPQVRGAGGQFKPAPDTNDFAAFERTYGGG
jgi:hypothetical protein